MPLVAPPVSKSFARQSVVILTTPPAAGSGIPTVTEVNAGLFASLHLYNPFRFTPTQNTGEGPRKLGSKFTQTELGQANYPAVEAQYSFLPQELGDAGADGNEVYEPWSRTRSSRSSFSRVSTVRSARCPRRRSPMSSWCSAVSAARVPRVTASLTTTVSRRRWWFRVGSRSLPITSSLPDPCRRPRPSPAECGGRGSPYSATRFGVIVTKTLAELRAESAATPWRQQMKHPVMLPAGKRYVEEITALAVQLEEINVSEAQAGPRKMGQAESTEALEVAARIEELIETSREYELRSLSRRRGPRPSG